MWYNILTGKNMNRFDKLRQEKSEYSEEYLKSTEAIADECKRTAYVAKHASEIIADIDKEFENATKLSKTDIAFLFLAVGLQCCRQYLFTDFKSKDERPGDQEQAEKTPGKETFDPHDQKAREDAGLEERHHKLYNPTLQEIILHPVPFDANRYNGMFEKGQEPLKGYGKLKHRGATIGHDPVLGLIFGTANIATSTLTTWDMRSYHILSQLGKGDIFACNADTSKVFYYTRKKLLNDGIEGKEIVATSLIKEIIHLQSDIDSKDSLPLPMVNLIDDKLASELAKYGLDMANVKTVAEQATFSMLINAIIGMIHRLFYNEEKDGDIKLYEVRTRKILSYSNLIASTSNVLVVAIGASAGIVMRDKKLSKASLRKIDIGGFLVTLHRLITDGSFIKQIKEEFLANRWYDIVVNA